MAIGLALTPTECRPSFWDRPVETQFELVKHTPKTEPRENWIALYWVGLFSSSVVHVYGTQNKTNKDYLYDSPTLHEFGSATTGHGYTPVGS